MESFRIKFRRSDDYALETYGSAVHQALNDLVGGEDKWDVRNSHGVAELGKTKLTVERHEDGPEIIGLILTELPNYIGAISGLVTLWWNRPRKKKKDSTSVSFSVGDIKVDGHLDNKDDVQRVITILEALAKDASIKTANQKPRSRKQT